MKEKEEKLDVYYFEGLLDDALHAKSDCVRRFSAERLMDGVKLLLGRTCSAARADGRFDPEKSGENDDEDVRSINVAGCRLPDVVVQSAIDREKTFTLGGEDDAGSEPAPELARAEDPFRPVYFDLYSRIGVKDIRRGGKPEKTDSVFRPIGHFYSPDRQIVDSEDVIVVRTYDARNRVIYQNEKYADRCVNYEKMFSKVFSDVKKAISEGKAGLTTKFDDQEPEYAKDYPLYSKEQIAEAKTPVVDPENPLSPIDEDEAELVRKMSPDPAEPKKRRRAAGKRKTGKKQAKTAAAGKPAAA